MPHATDDSAWWVARAEERRRGRLRAQRCTQLLVLRVRLLMRRASACACARRGDRAATCRDGRRGRAARVRAGAAQAEGELSTLAHAWGE
eukprot:CAMPEP_0119433216 /NCGR_PEP_ID=MMETSP1335-20130426/49250_1 /TAXON_ID=259385 /ORGANISM="Chrysoculter rhomboideus, Strain RCC1486" /LENGTH=89 /DNA_ID=CAMNT_0007459051 /DNA_START=21 /DNA_END=287 /DNA_ORIENTATION=+